MPPDQDNALKMLQQAHAVLRPTEELSLICLHKAFEALDESMQQELQDQIDSLQVAIDMEKSKAFYAE